MQTGTWRDRGIAWGVVLLWHVVTGCWLLRTLHADQAAVDDEALQIVYVDGPATRAPVRIAATRHPSTQTTNCAGDAADANRCGNASTKHVAACSSTCVVGGLSRDQARLAADHQSGTFAQHAFERTPPALPGAGSERFRIRSQITPQSSIAWVAKRLQLLPRGYTPDPCPRNNENIGNMMTKGDSAAMQQEVEFERAHCRP